MPGLVLGQCQSINLIMILNWMPERIHDVQWFLLWLSNCMMNELVIMYEPVLASSHFSREPLVLISTFLKKIQDPSGSGSRFFLKIDRTSSPVLDSIPPTYT